MLCSAAAASKKSSRRECDRENTLVSALSRVAAAWASALHADAARYVVKLAPLLDTVGPDIKDRQTLLRQLRIEMETFKVLTLLLAGVVLMASASPRIRSREKDVNDTTEDSRRNFVSCYQSIPCGWALYTTERRQPFRRISTYTRNRL